MELWDYNIGGPSGGDVLIAWYVLRENVTHVPHC